MGESMEKNAYIMHMVDDREIIEHYDQESW